jgi:hypothetical protein
MVMAVHTRGAALARIQQREKPNSEVVQRPHGVLIICENISLGCNTTACLKMNATLKLSAMEGHEEGLHVSSYPTTS